MSFQLLFYFILFCWLVFEIFFVYLKQGSRLGAKTLPGPLKRTMSRLLELCCFWPIILFFFTNDYLHLRANFSGVGIGSIIILMSKMFQWYAIQLLGPYYTADISVFQTPKIVEAGWYKTMRHPQYLANFMSFIGLALCFNGLQMQTISLIFPVLNYFLKIRWEEQALRQAWGNSYEKYLFKTYRLLPYIY